MSDKSQEAMKLMSEIIHDHTAVMQAAYIEWKHGRGAEAAMEWIENTLCGPGLIPDEDAEHGRNAQFFFSANQANPMPTCYCGNPSHIAWMGQGFCCDEHYHVAYKAYKESTK